GPCWACTAGRTPAFRWRTCAAWRPNWPRATTRPALPASSCIRMRAMPSMRTTAPATEKPTPGTDGPGRWSGSRPIFDRFGPSAGSGRGRALLQRLDADFDGGMRGEQGADGAAARDARGLEGLGQFAGLDTAQSRQGADHGFARAQQLGRAGVGAELALARKPGHDNG